MMEFLAANFNLPTIIVSIFVFGGTGWLLYHEHKTGGLGCYLLSISFSYESEIIEFLISSML